MSGVHAPAPSAIARNEFEFECVREFSHSGLQLGANVSREERRERIRTAILREAKHDRRWRDTQFTYAAVYQHVYGRPLDERRAEEKEIAPMRAKGTKLWGHDADVELT
ncbi:MAG: hypothetical protein ABSH33_09955 [Steroidobacteraceae bacterium]|jgi:hypothetical protein